MKYLLELTYKDNPNHCHQMECLYADELFEPDRLAITLNSRKMLVIPFANIHHYTLLKIDK